MTDDDKPKTVRLNPSDAFDLLRIARNNGMELGINGEMAAHLCFMKFMVTDGRITK